jgi:hypothetical protein
MENNEFKCPYCDGHLKANTKIILSARKDNGKRGLILFNPQLGEYDILKHDTFELSEGEHLDILCPLCHANLTDTTIDQNLAKILMLDETGNEYQVYFSEIVGMKCTYKIHGKKVEAFGEDAAQYLNYWGETPRY